MKSSDNFAALPGDGEVAGKLSGINSCLVVLCAGKGTRTGLGYNKMFYYSGNSDVLSLTLIAADNSAASSIVIVCRKDEEEAVRSHLALLTKPCAVCYGGETRTDSVRNALKAVPAGAEIVAIHDGARPFVSPSVINRTLFGAMKYGGAIAAVKSSDTVRIVKNGDIVSSPVKEDTVCMQTPQAFRTAELVDAYSKVSGSFDDDAAVYIASGRKPVLVEGDYANKKITTKEDLLGLPKDIKIGTGFDVHQFIDNRPLILGGVEIPFDKGLLGHSDADVLTHAVMDAILSAAGLPDIGVLFPDSDPAFEGISSMKLLATVMENVKEAGYKVKGVSGVIMAEKPKMAPVIPGIRSSLSKALGVDYGEVNISATTTEKLGIIGNEKGVAASAIAILTR